MLLSPAEVLRCFLSNIGYRVQVNRLPVQLRHCFSPAHLLIDGVTLGPRTVCLYGLCDAKYLRHRWQAQFSRDATRNFPDGIALDGRRVKNVPVPPFFQHQRVKQREVFRMYEGPTSMLATNYANVTQLIGVLVDMRKYAPFVS